MSQDTYLFIMFSDSPLFEARSRFGDRDGYRASSGHFGGDKEGAPPQGSGGRPSFGRGNRRYVAAQA
ncbi:hypothetical protein ACLB2K_075705 [Fragaria x ananassa]